MFPKAIGVLPWLSSLVPPPEFALSKKFFHPMGDKKEMALEGVQETSVKFRRGGLNLTTTVRKFDARKRPKGLLTLGTTDVFRIKKYAMSLL